MVFVFNADIDLVDEEWLVVNKPIGQGPTISSHNNKPFIGIIGDGMDLQKRIERAAKKLGISVITLGNSFEQFAQSTKVTETEIKENFSKMLNDIKPTIIEQPKSKYINKPQYNYKKR